MDLSKADGLPTGIFDGERLDIAIVVDVISDLIDAWVGRPFT